MQWGGAQSGTNSGCRNDGIWVACTLACFFVLCRFLPAPFVENHLWFLLGIREIPLWFLVLLLAAGYLLSSRVGNRLYVICPQVLNWVNPGLILVLGGILLFSFFLVFRDRMHAVGDAPQFQPLIEVLYFEFAPHAPLWNRIARAAVVAVYHVTAIPPTVVYAGLVAAVSGVGILVVLRGGIPDGRAGLFLWAVLAGQAVQIFFGQIEVYALAYIFETLFIFSAWRMPRGGGLWWAPALFCGLAIVCGAWNLLFVPSLAVISVWIIWNAPKCRAASIRTFGTIVLAIAPFLFVGGYSGMHSALAARQASSLTVFSPPPEGLWQPWTFEHLTGILNLILALGLPALTGFLLSRPTVDDSNADECGNGSANWGKTLFALTSIIPAILLTLIWYPVFGYRRDIDLFSFAVPPIAAWLCWREESGRNVLLWRALNRWAASRSFYPPSPRPRWLR